jgi:ribosomal protein S18 acetylase RimI-like enzyme
LTVGPLARDEERDAAELLAQAFHEEPLDRAVIGGGARRRLRVARAGMRASLHAARGRADVRAARAAGLAGVLLALPPWTYPLPPPPVGVQLRTLLRQGLRVAGRWREVFEALHARHPPEPLWYLSLLGVAPARQGRGVGSALVADWLADVDAAGEPAWLETSHPGNVGFYRRFGFRVADEIELWGVPVWLMSRPACAADAAQAS